MRTIQSETGEELSWLATYVAHEMDELSLEREGINLDNTRKMITFLKNELSLFQSNNTILIMIAWKTLKGGSYMDEHDGNPTTCLRRMSEIRGIMEDIVDMPISSVLKHKEIICEMRQFWINFSKECTREEATI